MNNRKHRNQKLAVSEYFYSIQGEGRTMGIPAIFVRLTGCNLMCGGYGVEKDGIMRDGATWVCDTIEVWMKGKTKEIAEWVTIWNEELDFVNRLNRGVHLVITGGEPLLQAERMLVLLEYLETTYNCRPTVEVETNATFIPSGALDARVHYWNTSPKLSNSGMPLVERMKMDIVQWFNQNPKTMFKFVISSKADFEEIETTLLASNLMDKTKLVLMPGASSLEELLEVNKVVAAICIQHEIRMCTRMHV